MAFEPRAETQTAATDYLLDTFDFVVYVDTLLTQEQKFELRLYSARYFEPLEIERLEPTSVITDGRGAIVKEKLSVSHPLVGSANITFLVTQLPKHGYLLLVE